jgi:hypothetical protein
VWIRVQAFQPSPGPGHPKRLLTGRPILRHVHHTTQLQVLVILLEYRLTNRPIYDKFL